MERVKMFKTPYFLNRWSDSIFYFLFGWKLHPFWKKNASIFEWFEYKIKINYYFFSECFLREICSVHNLKGLYENKADAILFLKTNVSETPKGTSQKPVKSTYKIKSGEAVE